MNEDLDDARLLASMSSAAAEAGDLLRTCVPTLPAAVDDWAAFKAAFDSAESPAIELIQRRLSGVRPLAGWKNEFGGDAAAGEYFLLDALDGAVQYLNALPYWAVSIAYVRQGTPVAAVVHNSSGDSYAALRGRGATRNGQRIQTGQKTRLDLALVATNQPPFVAQNAEAVAGAVRALSLLLPTVGVVRNYGPTSWQIANVASGHIDGFYQFGSDPGNLAAGVLVASEAGASVTTASGDPWTFDSPSLLVASPTLHAKLLSIIER